METARSNAALSLALAGWSEPAPTRRRIADAASLGLQAVQLDATAPDLRGRLLDRSARRDLAATLRRAGLGLSGLDLWIPPEHFIRPDVSDRALAATADALGLAADLASLLGEPAAALVCVCLPGDPEAPLETLAEAASSRGARLADHAWPRPPVDAAAGSVALGLDPAVLLIAGTDPVKQAAAEGPGLASARLADADEATRVPVGNGRLDVPAYCASLSVAAAEAPVVLDVRGLRDQRDAVAAGLDAWEAARSGF